MMRVELFNICNIIEAERLQVQGKRYRGAITAFVVNVSSTYLS